jgi:hypothetical protein
VPIENQENTLVFFRISGGIAVRESQQRKEISNCGFGTTKKKKKIWVIGSVQKGTDPSQTSDPEKVHGG